MEKFKNSPFVKKVGFNRIVLCGGNRHLRGNPGEHYACGNP